MWAWGTADKAVTAPAPIASISVGFTSSEKTAVIKTGLDPSMYEEFRVPFLKLMKGRSQITGVRADLYNSQRWKSTQMFANLTKGGLGEWLHSVRTTDSETWSCLWLLRRDGSPPFSASDKELIDLAMSSIPWLEATLDSSLPVTSCVELTPSQRVVLMMQLDGLSRKLIAVQLKISVDTVGDHIKKIYDHFEVKSNGELAALFLRNR